VITLKSLNRVTNEVYLNKESGICDQTQSERGLLRQQTTTLRNKMTSSQDMALDWVRLTSTPLKSQEAVVFHRVKRARTDLICF